MLFFSSFPPCKTMDTLQLHYWILLGKLPEWFANSNLWRNRKSLFPSCEPREYPTLFQTVYKCFQAWLWHIATTMYCTHMLPKRRWGVTPWATDSKHSWNYPENCIWTRENYLPHTDLTLTPIVSENASPCTQCMLRPNNTKTFKFGTQKSLLRSYVKEAHSFKKNAISSKT